MIAERDPRSSVTKLTIETVLRDGTPVRMRQVRPDDRPLLEAGMKRLSQESRYFRFFSSVSTLSESMLRRFTEIDHVDHEAVGALDIGAPAAIPIGIARYIRFAHQRTVAEVALTVVDSHQGRGLGTLMLAYLAQKAIDNGIGEFTAVVLGGNHKMLAVFQELGASKSLVAAGETDVHIPLFSDPAQYPRTPAGDVFRQVSALLSARPKPGETR